MSEQAKAKLNISLPTKVWEALVATAETEEITRTEALRRAIWTYAFLLGRVHSGCHVVIERPDGNSERVVFLS